MIRLAIVAACTLVLAAAVVPALDELPAFGHYQGPYGDVVVPIALAERHVTNVAAAVAYDVRGFDTLGEELVLFASVIGVALLLRPRGDPHRVVRQLDRASAASRGEDARRPAVRWASGKVLVLGIVFGCYVTLHATQTPGGGFQGGAMIASALVLIYLGFGYGAWSRLVREPALDVLEAAGVLVFVLCAALPLAYGAAMLWNWLPLGATGAFGSGGVMAVLNIGIGAAVAGGMLALAGSLLYDLHEDIEHVAEGESAE